MLEAELEDVVPVWVDLDGQSIYHDFGLQVLAIQRPLATTVETNLHQPPFDGEPASVWPLEG